MQKFRDRKSIRQNRPWLTGFNILVSLLLIVLLPLLMRAQTPQGQNRPPAAPPTLGLERGDLEFDTPDFTLKLVKASQTAAALQPKGGKGFDFTPADRLATRAGDGFYHLGDLTLRIRKGNSGSWQEYSTATTRKPVL